MNTPQTPVLEETDRDAQKLAGIGRFANVFAHDFNNLLTVIQAYTDLALRDKTLEGKLRVWMEAIRGAAESAAWLSRQLLVHSRRNTGVTSDVDLNLTVRQLSLLLKRVLPSHIAAELHLQENLPAVAADPGLIEQALLGVLTHVLGAVPEGGRLTIESSHAVAALAFVTLRVRAMQGNVAAGDASSATGASGTTVLAPERARVPGADGPSLVDDHGLALAAAGEIMQVLHGEMLVEGADAAGAGVTLRFPCVVAAPANADVPNVTPGLPSGLTVLVVDSDEAVRQSVASLLESHSCTALAAASGADALRIARTHTGPVHALLVDHAVRDVQAEALAAEFRRTRLAVPLLLLSGSHDVPPAGTRAFLAKPFAMADLVSALVRLLQPGALSAPDGPRSAPGTLQ